MKQTHPTYANFIDAIHDPHNRLPAILAKPKRTLVLELTPTKQHNPHHDLFRIYTFRLLNELSASFDIILIYRDIQATLDTSTEEAKRLVQENISLLRSANVPFQVYYESELLQKHLINMPEQFFKHLYHTILHKNHNHFQKHLMESSASLAVFLPTLELVKADVLLCMHDEKENINILEEIEKETGRTILPVIFYRSFPDLANRKHSMGDKQRLFPFIGWDQKKIYQNFKTHKTSFITIGEWYKKLGLAQQKIIPLHRENLTIEDLTQRAYQRRITIDTALRAVAHHLASFLEREGKFLERISKELKINFHDLESKKILECLNTPMRIHIINQLDKQNLTAQQLAHHINLSLPTTLFHLTKLQEANIIERDKNKTYHLKLNRFSFYT